MHTNWQGRHTGGSAIAEFGPVLWVFLILILIPLLDLLSFATGVGTVMMMANFGARQATGCMTFTDAQTSASDVQTQLSNYLKFVKATPINGGIQVAVAVTSISGATSAPGSPFSYASRASIPNSPPVDPNNPTSPNFNTANSVYQYMVTGSYNIMPLFNFAGMPFLRTVPVLGGPVPFSYTSTSSVEHPEGLQQ